MPRNTSVTSETPGHNRVPRWLNLTLGGISDLLLLSAITLMAGLFFFWQSGRLTSLDQLWHFEQTQSQTISLDIQDANAITKGSPVRFLGVQVGVVRKVWVDASQAHIRIKLDPGNPAIPEGAVATVSSYGLAGGKSLDFEPPTDEQLGAMSTENSPYETEAPIRTSQGMKYQLDVARLLQAGADSLNDTLFSRPVSTVKQDVDRLQKMVQHWRYKQREFIHKMPEIQRASKLMLRDLRTLEAVAEQAAKETEFYVNSLSSGNEEGVDKLARRANKALTQLNSLLGEQFSDEVLQGRVHVVRDLQERAVVELPATREAIKASLKKTEAQLNQLNKRLDSQTVQDIPKTLERIHNAIKAINDGVTTANPALNEAIRKGAIDPVPDPNEW